MKKLAVFLACVSILASVCCSNPKGQRITEKNKEAFLKDFKTGQRLEDNSLKEISGFKNLTKDEIELLKYYVLRFAVREENTKGKPPLPLVGKTVGELIELQRQWDKEQAAEEALQKKLEEEAKAKEEALVAELRNSLTVKVNSKKLTTEDYENNFRFLVTYQNNTKKDIKAFQGRVVFFDLFGDRVLGLDLKIIGPLKSGQTGTWAGGFRYNQFEEKHIQLKDTELKDLKVAWEPEKILFVDGTTITSGGITK